jgi:hypothetical protein
MKIKLRNLISPPVAIVIAITIVSSLVRSPQVRDQRLNGQATAMAKVAPKYAEVGQKDKASEILAQAFDRAKSTDDESSKQNALYEIFEQSVQVQQYEQAFQAAKLMPQDSNVKISCLRELAVKYLLLGQKDKASEVLAQAREVIQKATDTSWEDGKDTQVAQNESAKASFLSNANQEYAEAQKYEQALQAAKVMPDGARKARALSEVAVKYMRLDLRSIPKDKTFEVLAQARAAAQAEKNQSAKVAVLSDIDRRYTESYKYIASEVFLSNEQKYYVKGDKFAENAVKYAEARQYDQALKSAKKIDNGHVKGNALDKIIDQSTKEADKEKVSKILDEAVRVAKTIYSETEQAEILASIAVKYVAIGHKERASEVLTQALWYAENAGTLSAALSLTRTF